MSLAKDKPYYTTPSDYEDDVYAWAFEQAQLLRLGRFSEVDLPNVIEEIESVGREVKSIITNAYRDLIAILLEWEARPSSRTRENAKAILNARIAIEEEEREAKTLREGAAHVIESVYPQAVRLAAGATDLQRDDFPAECPYDLAFLRNLDAMPADMPLFD
ncbi:DUF29 domain-containing protein [Aurantimonas sp. VKM B-3413]|uniref:DUF29 domain-containing protein n=1 Tax=Aurantimonas sp. VKM B-3413 TaxID=2779401 RepID=UPI001E29349D|nr:DUF29 domain-containing protein [Aurantimonas sp. VKM B-3413]MCB8838430.1 DUF29 domain-containing protein [Aurantimonas sp. VKM B-3413]